MIAAGSRAKLYGLNVVGLERHGFPKEEILKLKKAYRILFRSALPLTESLKIIKEELAGEHINDLVGFIESSKEGYMPIKIALVGAGHMGKIHIEKLASFDDVQIAGVADVDRERAGNSRTNTRCHLLTTTKSCSAMHKVSLLQPQPTLTIRLPGIFWKQAPMY
ncbi:MAG: hypothetical protein MZV70_18645 [Desulfobacterales bacterium]|nr:hypothetical protein [Desulfobacterales bacterium]